MQINKLIKNKESRPTLLKWRDLFIYLFIFGNKSINSGEKTIFSLIFNSNVSFLYSFFVKDYFLGFK